MNESEMRKYVIAAYGGSKKWADKVSSMPAAQLYAVYVKIKNGEK